MGENVVLEVLNSTINAWKSSVTVYILTPNNSSSSNTHYNSITLLHPLQLIKKKKIEINKMANIPLQCGSVCVLYSYSLSNETHFLCSSQMDNGDKTTSVPMAQNNLVQREIKKSHVVSYMRPTFLVSMTENIGSKIENE